MSEGESIEGIQQRQSPVGESCVPLDNQAIHHPPEVPEEESLSPRDASTRDSQNGTRRRREKEALILQELSSTLHTLQNVSTVLEDIVSLTTLPSISTDHSKKRKTDSAATAKVRTNHNNIIAGKQQRLLQELRQWTKLLPKERRTDTK